MKTQNLPRWFYQAVTITAAILLALSMIFIDQLSVNALGKTIIFIEFALILALAGGLAAAIYYLRTLTNGSRDTTSNERENE